MSKTPVATGIDSPPPAPPASIRVIFLPRYANSPWIDLLGAAVFAAACYSVFVLLIAPKKIPLVGFTAIAGGVLGATALILIWKAGLDWWRRRYNRRLDALLGTLDGEGWEPSIAASHQLAHFGWRSLDTALPPYGGRRNWSSLRTALETPEHPLPKAIVDHRLHALVHAIELTPEVLDPEALDSRIAGDGVAFIWRSRASILVCAIAMSSCMALRSGWGGFFFSLLLCLVFYTVMAAWPILRPGIPRLRAAPIAGMGVIMDSRGRRWTSDDSTLIIEPKEQKISATLCGPAGSIRMRFHELEDEGFASLWRLWMHPKPDFDLLTRSA